jgi:hypothetical protein
MPTNRKRVDRGRTDLLNPNQRAILEVGGECFPWAPGFADDDHRREAWEANRTQIMAAWAHPGRRPDAYWEFDLGLEAVCREGRWTWRWPPPIQSEQEMVYDLLKRGKLKSCRFNGVHRIESEPRQIREDWLNEVRLTVLQAGGVPKINGPLPTWGTPVWLYEEHAPRVLAELETRGQNPASTSQGGFGNE